MLKYNGNPPDISGGKKSNILLALAVLIGLMILPQMALAQFDPPWWNDNWLHRAEITLNPATPSDSFQVKVELTTSNFTYANAQDDGDDLRFMYYDAAWFGLDYWIEEWDNTGTSTIWVEIQTSGTSTLYMYYGNAAGSAANNGDATFEFFDDSFTKETIDAKYLTNWTKSGSNPLQDKTCQNWLISVYSNYNSEDKIYLFEQRDAHPSNDIECWSFSRADADTPVNWTDEGVVFTSSQAWENGHTEPHGIIFETQAMADAREGVGPGLGTQMWRMYYCGKTSGASSAGYSDGFAVAPEDDLTSWTAFANNPVYNYDAVQGYADNKVCIYNNEVWMGLGGYHSGVSADPQFFTVSSDGISSWSDKTKNWNPEGIVLGTFVPFTEGILMTGRSSDRTEYNAYFTTDGDNKASYSGNPILTAGVWDEDLAWATIVVDKNGSYNIGSAGTYYMYYTGWAGSPAAFKLGLATSTTLTEESEETGFVKWISTGSPTISGGIASLDDNDGVGIIAKSTFGMNHSLRFRANLYSPVGATYAAFGLHGWDTAFDLAMPYEVFVQRLGKSYMDILTTNGGYIANLGTTYMDAFHKYEIIRKATSHEWFIDDISQATDSNPSTDDLAPMFYETGIEKADIDWAFVRKYADPEPTTTVGEEVTLPVELSAFTATYVNEFVTISWQTASETDVIGFNIYRSEEDDFSTTGSSINSDIIPGNGTTSETNEYHFTDETADPYYTAYYYWLEVVNLGGGTDLYGSIKYEPGDIDNNGEINIVYTHFDNCYPNPATSGNTIQFGFRLGGLELTNRHVELKVYNVLGELVEEIVNEDRLVDDYTEQWTPKNLPSGIYFYQLKTENYNETKKMLLLR